MVRRWRSCARLHPLASDVRCGTSGAKRAAASAQGRATLTDAPGAYPEGDGRSMRFRALAMIVLLAGWMAPAGGSACPSSKREAAAHSHANRLEAENHSGGHSEHRVAGHDHLAGSEAAPSAPSAPAEGPSCCRSDAKAPIVSASPVEAKSRSELASAAAIPVHPVLAPRVMVHLGGADFRTLQPRPLPFASSRRPLLI